MAIFLATFHRDLKIPPLKRGGRMDFVQLIENYLNFIFSKGNFPGNFLKSMTLTGVRNPGQGKTARKVDK